MVDRREGEMLKVQTCGVNLKKITIELLAVLHFEDFKIRHRYFHWIKVILSGPRLTHSLEVSSFAKSLGQNIGENILVYKKDSEFTPQMKEDICNILQCAGLIHDIGNPPFGHFGEDVIREWFERKLPLMTYHEKPMEQVMSRQMVEDLYL